MFPVFVYQDGVELPTEGTYFVIAGNGMWLRKDTGIVKAFVPVKQISVLNDLDVAAHVDCVLPPIPAKFVWQIKTFFKQVVERIRTEANVLLYYNKHTQEYKLVIPQQKVSHAGVEYRKKNMVHEPGMENFLCVGTIHSHCDFGAFHSSVDKHDEEDFDGLHITFGNNQSDVFTITASIVVNGFRHQVDPRCFLQGVEPVEDVTHGILKDRFHFLPEVEDGAYEKWSEEIVNWHKFGWEDKVCSEEICKGCKVRWAGDLSTVSFRSVCGVGPFVAEEIEDGQVTVNTNVGLARFSEKLFVRVNE